MLSTVDARRFRILACTVVGLAVLSASVSRHGPTLAALGMRLGPWLAAWLLGLLGLRTRWRRAALGLFLIAGAALARVSGNLASAVYLDLGVLGAHVDRPWFWYAGPGAVAAAAVWLVRGPLAAVPPDAWLNLLLTLGIVLLVGRYYEDLRRQRREQEQALADLTAAHAALAEATQQVGELAALRERMRLARDLHDTLGHALTAITVQLEAARRLLLLDADRAGAALREGQALARQALADLHFEWT
jgi:signal transduction histidine kinase